MPAHGKDTSLAARFRRFSRRMDTRNEGKAIFAELRRHVSALQRLGQTVTLTTTATA